jgi:hypothetical protein
VPIPRHPAPATGPTGSLIAADPAPPSDSDSPPQSVTVGGFRPLRHVFAAERRSPGEVVESPRSPSSSSYAQCAPSYLSWLIIFEDSYGPSLA